MAISFTLRIGDVRCKCAFMRRPVFASKTYIEEVPIVSRTIRPNIGAFAVALIAVS
jgi:hypothetical protein